MFIDCDRRESGRLTIIHAQNPGCDTLSRKSLTIGRGLADGYWWDETQNGGREIFHIAGLSYQYLAIIFLTTAAHSFRQSAGYIWQAKTSTTDELIILDIVRVTNEIVMKTFTYQDTWPPPPLLPYLSYINTIFTQGSPDNTENHPHRYLLYKLTRLWYLLSVYQYILYVFLFTMLSLIKDNV